MFSLSSYISTQTFLSQEQIPKLLTVAGLILGFASHPLMAYLLSFLEREQQHNHKDYTTRLLAAVNDSTFLTKIQEIKEKNARWEKWMPEPSMPEKDRQWYFNERQWCVRMLLIYRAAVTVKNLDEKTKVTWSANKLEELMTQREKALRRMTWTGWEEMEVLVRDYAE